VKYDYLIVGSGIIGMTIAYELIENNSNIKIAIIDKEEDVAFHASGRNSGVLHAGFYYSADSLKAKFTVDGNKLMKQFCKDNDIYVNETKKIVVAKDEIELQGIYELQKRAEINGVKTSIIDKEEVYKIDPNIKTYKKALYSPTTASVDPVEVCFKLKEVLKNKADLGVAFDGDGDRLIMVDHTGELVDGDQLLYVMAMASYAKGALKEYTAGTLMTNLGLEHAFKEHEIPFCRAGVGDRYVMEQLLDKNWRLGGESSGHLICLEQTTTGDGIVAALQVITAIVEQSKSLQQLASGMKKYPMVLINGRVTEKPDVDNHAEIQVALSEAEAKLADTGRVLLRPSGTEPLIRVMVEGQDKKLVESVANTLADVVKKDSS